jgi:hypothetical protein
MKEKMIKKIDKALSKLRQNHQESTRTSVVGVCQITICPKCGDYIYFCD